VRFLFVGCFKGQRTQPQVGVRKTLAFSCVMQRVYLSRHFVSFRNISQNCPMPSSPVNVTFCPSTSIRYCERVRFKGQEPNHRLAFGKRLRFSVQRTFCHCERNVAISRKGHRIIKPTQDTFVLAWRKKAHTSKRVSIVAPTMRFQKCSVRREQPR